MRSVVFAVCSAYLAGLATGGVTPTVYDAFEGFSIDANPGDPWSYGYSATAEGGVSLLTLERGYGNQAALPGWARAGAPDGLPAVGVNTSDALYAFGTARVPALSVVVHPGNGSDEAFVLLRFTAPQTGLYTIDASFATADIAPSDVRAIVLAGGDVLFNDAYTTGSVSFSTASSLSLDTGDTVDFRIGRESVYFNDSTTVVATVTLIPTPGVLAAISSACVLLSSRRRR